MNHKTTSNRLPVLADEVRRTHAEARTAARFSAEKAIEAGHLLIEAKASVEHGGWLPWLKQTGLSERTARDYMQLARSGIKSATVADLGLRATLRRLSKRKEVELAPAGELPNLSFEPGSLVELRGWDDNDDEHELWLWSHDGRYVHVWGFGPDLEWRQFKGCRMMFTFPRPIRSDDLVFTIGGKFPLHGAEIRLDLRAPDLTWLDTMCQQRFRAVQEAEAKEYAEEESPLLL
jgi:Protein of unknown function (DUF3102)